MAAMRLYAALCFLVFILALPTASVAGQAAPEGFADLVEKLTPAVVNISTTQTADADASSEDFAFPFLPPGQSQEEFNEFFKRFIEPWRGRGSTSLGSGFVVDPSGYIVTNSHVIEGADEITITFSDEEEYKAKLVGNDAKTDLALLKIEAKKELPHVKFGDSNASRVGDSVVVIGNPFGLGGSVSTGIISARARDINAGPFDDFLQTDAAINRGNSGGPMFNIKGEVIGINTAIFSPSGGSVGIGFAMPSSLAAPVIDQLKEKGKIERGWLGVRIQHVTDDIAESIGLDKARGALVAEVIKDGPAAKAGIKSGDVILEFDGKDITVMKKLPRTVAETVAGKKVSVKLLRGGKEMNIEAVVEALKEEQEEDSGELNGDEEDENKFPSNKLLGMKLTPLTDQARKQYGIGDDVSGLLVVGVEFGSGASDRGVRKGDIVVEASQKKLKSAGDLSAALEEAKKKGKKAVLLLIAREGDSLFVALPMDDASNGDGAKKE